MTTLLLRNPPTKKQLTDLIQEFPQCEVLNGWEGDIREEVWRRCEIVYTDHITAHELEIAGQLQWIHTPQSYFEGVSLKELRLRDRLLCTNTRGQNVLQIGEYVLGATLGFAKNLFLWTGDRPKEDLPPMWTLDGRIFLQIGLGLAGTEITRRMRNEKMRVWGLAAESSFHPHCERTFAFSELHSLLPAVDVLCISLQRGTPPEVKIGKREIELLKKGALVVCVYSEQAVDFHALADRVRAGDLRGVVVDASNRGSPLAGLPQVLLTPDIATHPESTDPTGFHTFHFNLRQFLHHQHYAMKNIIDLERVQCD